MTDQTDRHKAALIDRYSIERELEALPPTPGRAAELGQIYAALGNREETLRWFEYEPVTLGSSTGPQTALSRPAFLAVS